eukprot:TRINITY_DN10213_c0_g1_i2.p2 TRINITY_DN10213_c0_g1~~TRINITY_DN10213_c0_g1_i2.p2  ORF type:complete len:144 (+),score=37.15 TRINITY_DN10213_c0_g1_i2:67-498(+)
MCIRDRDSSSPRSSSAAEIYKFAHNFPGPPPILYCYFSQTRIPPCFDPAASLALLESVDLSARFPPHTAEVKEEVKGSKRFVLESVKAAIKVTLKCKTDSGHEQQQGFADNIRSLANDMGVSNTIKYILPKVSMILVLSDSKR